MLATARGRTRLCLTLFATALWALPATARLDAGDATPLRIVTSNIRFAGDEQVGLRWEDRRDRLAALLSDAQPDLIATQEGWETQLRDVEARLQGMGRTDGARRWVAGRMYPTIFYRRERLALLDSGDRWLSDAPETVDSRFALSPYPRTMAWAKLRDRRTGEALFVVNTHLTHLFGWVRRAQAQVLGEQIRWLNPEGLPVILLGDFNERPTGGTRDTLASLLPELRDPWGRRDPPELTTFNAFGGWFAGGRIDWILVDRRLRTLETRILRESAAPGPARFVSDHDPVFVAVALR